MTPDRQALGEFLGKIELSILREQRANAIGWIFVVVDDESGAHVHAVGLFPDPESALLASEAQKVEDRRMNEGEPLWTHHILPVWSP